MRIGIGTAEPGRSRSYILLKEACEEAQQLGHGMIDSEHFLIALARDEESMSAKALSACGMELASLGSAVKEIAPATVALIHGELTITPQAKSAQECAWDEAEKLGHVPVGPEHLLLALLYQPVGICSRVFDAFGVERRELRFQIFKQMRAGND